MQSNCFQQIKKNYTSMSEVEKRLADFVLAQPARVVNMTTKDLAGEVGVSEGSVINFANQMGFPGFTKLKINLAQNLGQQNDVMFDNISQGDSPKEAFRKMIDQAKSSFEETYQIISSSEFDAAARLLMNVTQRIDVYGVGSSSMIANDASFRLMRIGLPAYSVTDGLIGSVSAFMLGEGCAAVAISHTGRTVETLRAMETAKKTGAKTLCITAYAGSPLAALCDVSLIVKSHEAEYNREAGVSRLTQQLLIDSLCSYISSQRRDESLVYLENMVDTFGEHR